MQEILRGLMGPRATIERLGCQTAKQGTEAVENILNQLIENNAILQSKIADLVISVNTLSKSVNNLVNLFTKAADLIEKGEIKEPALAEKLNSLLEQNKSIARGLIMLEQYVREKAAMPRELPRI